MKTIRLHWNRTGKRGVWTLPVSQEQAGTEWLPEKVRAEIESEAAREEEAQLDIHLMHRWSTDRIARKHTRGDWELHARSCGIVLFRETGDENPELSQSMHYAKLLVGGGAQQRPVQVRWVAQPAAAVCGNGYREPKAVEAVYETPGRFGRAPGEAEEGYAAVYRGMSKRMQAVLREWMPGYLLGLEGIAGHGARTAAVLVWTASRPLVGRHIDELSPSVLQGKLVDRSLRSAEEGLRPVLGRTGPGDGGFFVPENAEAVMRMAMRERPFLLQIYQAESRLIENLIRFCAEGQGLAARLRRNSGPDSRAVMREVERLWKGCVMALRRFPGGRAPYAVLHRLAITMLETLEAEEGTGEGPHRVNYPYKA